MGNISIKITDIQIPNYFRVYYKADNGSGMPYPITDDTWTDYGLLVGTPIYSVGTTSIMLSGTTVDFQYSTTYWIKLEEVDYPDRYDIKNIRINDQIAYQSVIPLPSPSPSVTPSPSYIPSSPSPTPSISVTPSTSFMSPSPSVTPSTSFMSPSPSPTPSTSPPINCNYNFVLNLIAADMSI